MYRSNGKRNFRIKRRVTSLVSGSFVLVNRGSTSIPVYGEKVHINLPLPSTDANFNTVGQSRPWCYYASKIEFADGRADITSGKFVSTGLEYASSGSERAWY